jgi:hypothetical protein
MNVQEFIKYFEALSVTTRILSVVLFLFFLFIFRDFWKANAVGIVLVLLGKKKLEELFKPAVQIQRYALRTKVVYQFPPNCMMNPKGFIGYVSEKVKKHRELGEAIVFDLTTCEYCNRCFEKEFIDLLSDMIAKNSVQCNIIFPHNSAFKDTETWLDQKLASSGSKSINKWTDKNQKENK